MPMRRYFPTGCWRLITRRESDLMKKLLSVLSALSLLATKLPARQAILLLRFEVRLRLRKDVEEAAAVGGLFIYLPATHRGQQSA